jgi:CBS-domain-containing membrane protein
MDSSALLVMTDLKRVAAVVTSPQDTMEQAHAFMMQRGVRMLLVIGEQETMAGILTTNDVLGESPSRGAGTPHPPTATSSSADVMTPRRPAWKPSTCMPCNRPRRARS